MNWREYQALSPAEREIAKAQRRAEVAKKRKAATQTRLHGHLSAEWDIAHGGLFADRTPQELAERERWVQERMGA